MRLPRDIAEVVIAHLAAAVPEEGCGLLAIDDAGEVRHAYCLDNLDRSPVRFTVDPDGHFAALRHAESNGWKVGGAFHSHPRSAAVPSRTDIARALDPEWVHLIVGLGGQTPQVRAWRIRDGEVTEEPLERAQIGSPRNQVSARPPVDT